MAETQEPTLVLCVSCQIYRKGTRDIPHHFMLRCTWSFYLDSGNIKALPNDKTRLGFTSTLAAEIPPASIENEYFEAPKD